jgi:two-component system LytT family response regulator
MQVLIFEDEMPAAQRLQKMLTGLDPGIEICAILETTDEALNWLSKHPNPDLIISDVELADGLCFEIFARHSSNVPVIFATAYHQYAIRAFEANAIDYLLKPISQGALRKSIERWKERLGTTPAVRNYTLLQQQVENKIAPSKQFVVRFGTKMLLIPSHEPAYYYSSQKTTYAVLPSGKCYPLDESLNNVEEHLSASDYFRINRNLIVARSSIGTMTSKSKGRLELALIPELGLNEYCTVSADRSPDFRKWISG